MAFQSKNINGGHFLLAAFGSIGIGASQGYVWKAVTAADAGAWAVAVYSISGGLGCVSAMYMHRRLVKPKKH